MIQPITPDPKQLTKKALRAEILRYDANDLHAACNDLGFSTAWESFQHELRTYTVKDDLESLLGWLQDLAEGPIAAERPHV